MHHKAGNKGRTHSLGCEHLEDETHMATKEHKQPVPSDSPEKEPEDWVTGDESMTGPQRSYLETLCREAGKEFDQNLSKAQASERIEKLQRKTGRGRDH